MNLSDVNTKLLFHKQILKRSLKTLKPLNPNKFAVGTEFEIETKSLKFSYNNFKLIPTNF